MSNPPIEIEAAHLKVICELFDDGGSFSLEIMIANFPSKEWALAVAEALEQRVKDAIEEVSLFPAGMQ